MIKVVYCIQKPDDMDSKEFNRYWSNDIQLAAFFGGSFNAYRGVSPGGHPKSPTDGHLKIPHLRT